VLSIAGCTRRAGCSVYLLEDGHLLRPYAPMWPTLVVGEAKGLEEYDWDGNLLWAVELQGAGIYSHHDIQPLPNGNILLIVTDVMTAEDAILNGRDPDLLTDNGLWIDSLREIQPVGDSGFEVVWEWHLTDHLVQDLDDTKANYGSVEGHPELLDINLGDSPSPDFTHANSVNYNESLDQVVITMRHTNELLIIDHSTTTAEAAAHTGGRYGKGGDFLYRWGNPLAYRAGALESQVLYDPHDAEWIPEGYPGAGNLLMFSNGSGRTDALYSSVCEIVPPMNPDGTYVLEPGSHQPALAVWEFVANPPESLYSSVMSGSQRLPDGNTLICSTEQNWLLEVTPAGEIVWEHTLEPGGIGQLAFRVDRYAVFEPWLNSTP
jgi:hypothetical protein